MNELKRCPFCGEKAEDGYIECFRTHWISCSNEACPMHKVYFEYPTEEEAIAAWNTRSKWESEDCNNEVAL